MAGISLYTNLPALMSNRRLGNTTARLQRGFERLSSGLRISRSADDAAGLSISEALRTDVKVYTQGLRNVNDGISITNIADSTLNELTNIVTRLEELAEQAANGTLGRMQREALNAEAQALAKEYFRISRVASFNGLDLFDGSTQSLRLQAGYGAAGGVDGSFGGKLGTGDFEDSAVYSFSGGIRSIAIGDLNGDGISDVAAAGTSAGSGSVLVQLGNGDGTFRSAASYASEEDGSSAVALGDLNGDGILDLVTAGYLDDFSGAATVRLGNGDGSFKGAARFAMDEAGTSDLNLEDLNNDGYLDLVTGGAGISAGTLTVRLGTGTGSFGARASYAIANGATGLAIGDLNGDGFLDVVASSIGDTTGIASVILGNGDGSFRSAASYEAESAFSRDVALGDFNGDGIIDLATTGYNGSVGYATIRVGNGDGTFGAASSYAMDREDCFSLTLGDLNGDGKLDMVTAGYDNTSWSASVSVRFGNGDGSFGNVARYISEPVPSTAYAVSIDDLNNDGVLDLISGSNGSLGNRYLLVRLQSTQSGISPLLPFSLKTKADALQALPVLQQSLSRISAQRGTVGSLQSRLSSALATLSASRENFESARSAITDVDVAEESAVLVRNQITQNAASAILSQAILAPELALLLLEG